MMTAEQNYRLLQEIQANRQFLLLAYQQNPQLLERAETRIKEMFGDSAQCDLNGAAKTKQRGVSLIELIMFIVIISIAIAGILLVMNRVTANSADTLVRKQALAVAESLLEEIELQGVSGVNAATGSANADRTAFDNVFNYKGYNTTGGIQNMDTTPVSNLTNYNVKPPVDVDYTTAAWGGIPAGNAVVITVHVTGPGGRIDLTGYRAGN